MLDVQHSKCSIYEDRPLACRLFPLDLFYRDRKPEWGIYNYCPTDNIKPINTETGELELLTLSLIATQLEKRIPKNVLNFLIDEDGVISEIEILDRH